MSVHVSSWAWKQKVEDPEAKLVLLKLADQANDNGECWPSRNTIAEACEVSVSTVQRRLNYLVERKLLMVEQRARPGGLQTSNLYTIPYLSLPLGHAGSTVTHRDLPGGSAADPPAGSPTDPPGGSTVTRQEPSVKPSSEASLNQARGSLDEELELDGQRLYGHFEEERTDRHAVYETGVPNESLKHLAEMRKKLGL